MASRSSIFDIIVRTKDQSSAKLKTVSRSLRETGRAGESAAFSIKDFNRTLFATTAFVGTVQRAFMGLASVMDLGTQIDRLDNQVSKYYGSKGELFKKIKEFTDNSIDRQEALNAAVHLSKLGLTKDLADTAKIIAMAGTAAKMAGLDSGEGIKHFTKFLKDGAVSHLSYLGLIEKTNPKLQAELSILKATTGILGGVISTQQKLIIARRLLAQRTKDALKGERDLRDTMKDVGESFKFAKAEIGIFLGKALQPVLEKFINLFDTISLNLENINKLDKNVMFLGRTLLTATGAAVALGSALITLKLISTGLLSIGFGFPAVTIAVTALTAAFLSITETADGFVNRLRVLGAVFRGTFQLVRSFLTDPENFARGIGKMDQALNDLLDQHGLLGFVKNLSRAIILTVKFSEGLYEGVTAALNVARAALETFLSPLREFLGMGDDPWDRKLIDKFKTVGFVIGATTTAILALAAAFKAVVALRGLGSIFKRGPAGSTMPTGGGGFLSSIFGAKPLNVFVVNMPRGGFGGPGDGDLVYDGTSKRGGKYGGPGSSKRERIARKRWTRMHPLSKIGRAGGMGFAALYGLGQIGSAVLDEDLGTKEKATQISGGVGSIAGGLAGAKLGAVAGTAGGPLGVLLGALAGGIAGSIGGEQLGELIGEGIGDRLTESIKAAVKTPETKKTSLVVPDTQDQRIMALGEQFHKLDEGSEKQKVLEELRAALSPAAGQKDEFITTEEYKTIFEMMNNHLSKIAGNTEGPASSYKGMSGTGHYRF